MGVSKHGRKLEISGFVGVFCCHQKPHSFMGVPLRVATGRGVRGSSLTKNKTTEPV